jgi:hypothetical protein
MSDQNPDQMDGDTGDDGTAVVQIPRSNIRALEKAAKAGQQAQAELAALRREMTFREVGIDPSNAAHKYFIKGYDGETTPEAIRAAAAEAGFLKAATEQAPPQSQPQTLPPHPDMEVIGRFNAVTSGPQNPTVDQDAAFLTALSSAKSEAEVMEAIQRFGVPTPGIE